MFEFFSYESQLIPLLLKLNIVLKISETDLIGTNQAIIEVFSL